ncbi:hypothetical protein PLEI_3830 [Photobacterium leiognathi lrivu.4.1]|uniref:Uncharacterized protein n=1 Tax=Photobacterium leiognathi lrivu.4.1 TaxID=1248232 RepID=V5EQW2_PHOLE|nr:hypothetical protein PLEI_3830 [Photobacterium leiognathi lrivu.4.1]
MFSHKILSQLIFYKLSLFYSIPLLQISTKFYIVMCIIIGGQDSEKTSVIKRIKKVYLYFAPERQACL